MNTQMKKFIYLMTGVALAAGVSSCVDTEKPVFQEPTTFTVNAPALQNEYLATTGDMEDKSTFVLTCSQPDYGFAAKANYNAQMSLTGEFKDEVKDEDGAVVTPATYVTLANQDVNNAVMQLRTYNLAVGMCSLLGIDSEEAWDEYIADGGQVEGFKVYFRATCEIAGVAGSFIASNNVVTYNNVALSYAVPTAGMIYIVGDVGEVSFATPDETNKEIYQRDYALIEPEIGCKIYAGTFTLRATEEVHAGATGVDYTTQFRFFTELVGWDKPAYEIASAEGNFYVEDITGAFSDGANLGSTWTGNGVNGNGNWGIYLAEPTEVTIAVSLVDKPKVYIKVGKYDVTIAPDASGINEPVFNEPEAAE